MSKVPLHYEAQEPAFLRRLKAGFSESDGRNNIQHARPKKSRLKTSADDPDEDEPVIVDESGEVVGKEEWEDRLKGDSKDANGQETEKLSDTQTEASHVESKDREQQKIAGLGGTSKKRKVGKVVGGTSEEVDQGSDDQADSTPVKSMSKATNDLKSVIRESTDAAKRDADVHTTKIETSKADTSGKKKKAKKIKLSFEEPE